MEGYATKKTTGDDGVVFSWYLAKEGGRWTIFTKFENHPEHGIIGVRIGSAWKEGNLWIADFADLYGESHRVVCTMGFGSILSNVEAKLQILAQNDMAHERLAVEINFNEVDEIQTSWQ